jgi:transposase
MSLQWQISRTVPADTAVLGQQLFAEDQPYRMLGDRFDAFWPEEQAFAPLYEPTGRGAIPPLLLALVTVFQLLEKVPDRQAAELVVSRIDWKYALHLPLGYTGFHFTDLYAFRVRLLEHETERLLFDRLLDKLKAMQLIKGRGMMRTDSTHVLAVAQRLSQLELVSEALRVALAATLAMAGSWVEANVPHTLQEAYASRLNIYGWGEQKVQTQLAQVAKDAFWFLERVEQSAPKEVHALPEIEMLRTVLAQQFPQGPNQPPAKRPSGRDVIETPHEVEARRATKRGQSWIGYKVQVTETCAAERPHLIVDLEPTNALDNDCPELSKIQARLQAQGTLPDEQQVDQGYMSGENLVQSAEIGINLLGIPLADTQAPKGFQQDDFQIDPAQRQATCPAGQTSVVWAQHATRPGQPPATQIRFAGETCQRCSFFGQCTTSAQGRSLTLHPYREALQARRAEAQTEAFRERLHPRAGVEGTISELTRAHEMRHARYRGQRKLRLQTYFTATAVNIKRAVRWLSAFPATSLSLSHY